MSSESILIEWPNTIPVPLMARTHKQDPRSLPTLMESGRLRNRRQFTDSIELIEATWNFTVDQFSLFKIFFETELTNGSRIFQLTTSDFAPPGKTRSITYALSFWEGNYAFTRTDNLFTVKATLEVSESFTSDINTPPPPVPLVDLPVTYPDNPNNPGFSCREDIIFTMDNLNENSVYILETAELEHGPFTTHIYFGLLEAEKSSKRKVLTLNNDYNGERWFRYVRTATKLVGAEYVVISHAIKPLASVIAPPVISIANLSEFGPLEPFQFYGAGRHGTNFYKFTSLDVRPWSSFEDPTWNDDRYSRISNVFAGMLDRYGGDWGDLGGNSLDDPQVKSEDNHVILTLPPGTTGTFTRDWTDPEIDTLMPVLAGIVDNAFVNTDSFRGAIKARAFNGVCRSPLAIVAVDKLFPELPYCTTYCRGASISGYCDKTGSSLTGFAESGYSCKDVWGGVGAFEAYIENRAENCSGITNIDGPPARQAFGAQPYPLLYVFAGPTLEDKIDYLGWTNHNVHATAYNFLYTPTPSEAEEAFADFVANGGDPSEFIYLQSSGFTWARTGSGWETIYPLHNRPVIEINTPLTVLDARVRYTEVGEVLTVGGHHDTAQWNAPVSQKIAQIMGEVWDIIGFPNGSIPQIHSEINLFKFDIWQTALIDDAPGSYWTQVIIAYVIGLPDPPVSGPRPPIVHGPDQFVLLYSGDDFEAYADQIAAETNDGLLYGHHWDPSIFTGPWKIELIDTGSGDDTFEFYAVGLISDGDVTFDKGEGFGNRHWVIELIGGEPAVDDNESYTDGVLLRTDVLNGGTGFYEEYILEETPVGTDDMETYTVGPIPITMEGGIGWTSSEGWIIE